MNPARACFTLSGPPGLTDSCATLHLLSIERAAAPARVCERARAHVRELPVSSTLQQQLRIKDHGKRSYMIILGTEWKHVKLSPLVFFIILFFFFSFSGTSIGTLARRVCFNDEFKCCILIENLKGTFFD